MPYINAAEEKSSRSNKKRKRDFEAPQKHQVNTPVTDDDIAQFVSALKTYPDMTAASIGMRVTKQAILNTLKKADKNLSSLSLNSTEEEAEDIKLLQAAVKESLGDYYFDTYRTAKAIREDKLNRLRNAWDYYEEALKITKKREADQLTLHLTLLNVLEQFMENNSDIAGNLSKLNEEISYIRKNYYLSPSEQEQLKAYEKLNDKYGNKTEEFIYDIDEGLDLEPNVSVAPSSATLISNFLMGLAKIHEQELEKNNVDKKQNSSAFFNLKSKFKQTQKIEKKLILTLALIEKANIIDADKDYDFVELKKLFSNNSIENHFDKSIRGARLTQYQAELKKAGSAENYLNGTDKTTCIFKEYLAELRVIYSDNQEYLKVLQKVKGTLVNLKALPNLKEDLEKQIDEVIAQNTIRMDL